MLTKAACIDQNYNKTIIQWNIIAIFKISLFSYDFNIICSCDAKLNVLVLLQSLVSHDSSEIILMCSRNISYYQISRL